MANDSNNIQITDESQIVLYQLNERISLQVKIDASHDTVWLTQQQIADLFGTKRPAITKHLRNIFNSGELDQNSVSSILEHTAADGKTYKTQFYNLDAIISVGYRVNSINATAFRRWATRVLNNYLLKGYSVNQQLLAMQRQFDSRLEEHSLRMTRIEDKQAEQQEQLDFFIRTSTPPAEMVFFEGDFYTARVALENLVRSASHRVIVIDAYVSALTLDILNVRKSGVEAIIYTMGVGQGMLRLMNEHDRLFPDAHIDIRKWSKESHDRWLVIDDTLYHCGHSLNANGGHKISAITRMGISPEDILSVVG
ncbi:virulence RhuM family protein [Segatella copri]|uniref:virulence RhuM family protein n=1 Tax=Segatella copri TaxID=165179 RepID=UPI001C479140|nr:RhuM family protein [Segatella copri]MBW0024897.1 virulence RhuM family protein [Segatella copri]